jgi:predicted dehydrogenase
MLRTGIIGMGDIGRHLACEVIDSPDATITAAVDVDPDTLRTATDELDIDAALFADESEMYAEVSLDAVVIATPPSFHYRQILDAFDRDLHVLCEKPLVTTRENARKIAERVRSSPEMLMVGYQRHLNPGFIRARKRWQAGDIEPRFITGELTQDWRQHFESDGNWRTDPEVGGGGHLFSVGTHVIESVLWMTGLTPEAVTAEMEFHEGEKIDTQSALTVRFENGAIASFGDSAVVPATREHIHVWDDNGAVYLEGDGWNQRQLRLVDQNGTESVPELAYEETQTKFEAFAKAIKTDSAPPATAADALRVTALLEAAYESARMGDRVTVEL